MEQLVESGKVRYAWVGVATTTLTASLAKELDYPTTTGAAIESVVPDSPAAKAGLRGGSKIVRLEGAEFNAGGDVVVAIDGTPVTSSEDLVRIISGRLFPGQTARLTVLRDGERIVVPVVLVERPEDPDAPR